MSRSGLLLLLALGVPPAATVAPALESQAPEAVQASATFEATLAEGSASPLKPVERLGKLLFFDRELSEPRGQACAVCHGPEAGWTGPELFINLTGSVYEGAVRGRFGNRKPPSSAYATQAPILHLDVPQRARFVGGNFWDGRATGEKLGNPAADQAQGPFLNPVEQNNPSAAAVVAKVCRGRYGDLFRAVYGTGICGDVPHAYDSIALAIAAYEGSREVNAFSSKYDAWLAGRAALTRKERWGLELFEGKARCSNCHTSRPGPGGEPPLFTDYTFDNLGVPRNLLNPWYWQIQFNPEGPFYVDLGLGGFLFTRDEWTPYARANLGKVKVPTLRNVDKRPYPSFVKAYGHNGYFKSLESIVHFYNTRDVLPVCLADVSGVPGVDCWPVPEVGLNLNTREVGNLRLSPQEEHALVAFLGTLSDGYARHEAE
ncbi:cytochrome-c peroxidase [Corallococcus carmarthensis]|uniref:Cytochrome C n=1 Tax=Corallococcus carmarthensis TaxID=2316728 RepID=A0A3A8KET7_9BACT|nr:cytochrome c peroxidase [Corallococcus carmarthensis]RKH06673.1 cytochrome C [Corallococcus carmarthensis]